MADSTALTTTAGLKCVLAAAPAGATTQVLVRFLAPQRAGDPLGLGIAPGERPPAPADPDHYDRERENAEYARSLLGNEERVVLDQEIEEKGFMTIDEVRNLVAGNSCKGEVTSIDPEMMAAIDARINYKLFVAEDNIYTREELYDHFPFHEFAVQPEAMFVQQEIGIFPPKKHAMRQSELEYIARDVGDESVDFMMLEDLVGQATRKGYVMKRPPLRVAKTKIYIGKEQWEDFILMQKVTRSMIRTTAAHHAGGGHGMPGAFALLTGAGAAPAPLMLTDPATLEAERAARSAAAAEREAECARREEEIRQREAEAQRRIDADLKRIEAMLIAASAMTATKAATAPVKAAPAKAAPAKATPAKVVATPANAAAAPAKAAAAPAKVAAAPAKVAAVPTKAAATPAKAAAAPASAKKSPPATDIDLEFAALFPDSVPL